MATETIEIIPLGEREPGCYVTPGHVDLAAFIDAVKREYVWSFDDWDEDHEPPRHTWMVVMPADHMESEVDWYREVAGGTAGAEPYTLIACRGNWTGPQP